MEKAHISETLEKGLGILNLFNASQQGFKLTEVSRALGVNKTSTYRFLNTYCKLGYLRKDPKTKLFKLGPRTVALAYTFIQGSDLVDLVKPIVDRAYLKHRVHIDVGLLHGDSIYALYRRENKDTIHFRHFTRDKGLHFLASGKAVLAFLPREAQEALVEKLPLEKKTPRTIIEKRDLSEELKKIREKGYSVNNEEFIPGLIALGAPLINHHTGQLQGAISFDASTSRYTIEAFESQYAVPLMELAKELSAVLPNN